MNELRASPTPMQNLLQNRVDYAVELEMLLQYKFYK